MNTVTPVTTIELVTRLAKSYLWVREIGGSNRGEAVEYILSRVHLSEGNPWCAAFVSMIGQDAFDKDWPLPMTGSCANLGDAAAKKEMLYKVPAPGAVFLLWSRALRRFHHTGFVIKPTKNGWATIEGNTNADGGVEGEIVGERERDFGPHDRFIYWWRPLE